MDILYAPWREEYALKAGNIDTTSKENCVFCSQLAQDKDEEFFILGRYTYHCIMLNRYPYNSGHLLILPFEHSANLEDISTEAQQELIYLINQCTTLVKTELKAHGVNIGINLGKAAGAGIPGHLHAHVLPRWQGDTNFLPTLAQIKQVSTDLTKLYTHLRPKCLAIKQL